MSCKDNAKNKESALGEAMQLITLAENIKKTDGEIDGEDRKQLNVFLLDNEYCKAGLNYTRLMRLVPFIEKAREKYESRHNEYMGSISNGMDRR